MAVFVNSKGVLHKQSSTGMTMAFPDVCVTPTPAGGVPIPYPNIAKTATTKQQGKKPGGPATTVGGGSVGGSVGDMAGGTKAGVTSNVTQGMAQFASSSFGVHAEGANVVRSLEAAQLRSALDDLHRQLRGLSPGNPDRWQAIVQSYAVAASALYVTITDD